MKVFSAAAVCSLVIAASASAGSINVLIPCVGTNPTGFGYTNLVGSFTQSGTLACPGDSGGIGPSYTGLTVSVLLNTDLTGAVLGTESSVSTSFSNSSIAGFVADTLTTDSVSGQVASPYLTVYTTSGGETYWYDPTPAGVADPVADFTVNYTAYANGANGTMGSVTGMSGAIYVDYSYSPVSFSPEPVSMILFGSGLLAASLIGRKKYARK